MLYSIGASKDLVVEVPHAAKFEAWKRKLSSAEIADIKAALNGMINSTEVHTSSWMPGADWSGTPFDPIYTKACALDEEAAARCFGLFVWEVFMEHNEAWSFGRFEKDGMPIEGMTYFKI